MNEPLLEVYEDREASESSGEEEVRHIQTASCDPSIPRRPKRAARFPTDYSKAPEVVTQEETSFWERAGAGVKIGGAEQRPAGLMAGRSNKRSLEDNSASPEQEDLARHPAKRKAVLSSRSSGKEARLCPLSPGMLKRRQSAEKMTTEAVDAARLETRETAHELFGHREHKTADESADPNLERASGSRPRGSHGQGMGEKAGVGSREGSTTAERDTMSQLHHEILDFERRATPTEKEQRLVKMCLRAVQASATRLWPHSQTAMFGSQAAGLAMPGSDIDIVVLNVADNLLEENSLVSKNQVKALLGELRRMLRVDGVLDLRKRIDVIPARVPIIKCSVIPINENTSLRADISLGVGGGVQAVEIIRKYVSAMRPLRPLVLTIKTFLKDRHLHEVHTGGLSSYSLVNMVVAHLMAEGYRLDAGNDARAVNKDLGHLLWGFFTRFGTVFDYHDQAISILQGGVIKKRSAWRIRFKPYLLAVEDPQQPGRDIAAGSFNIQRIQELFAAGAEMITEAVEKALHPSEEDSESQAWSAVQAEGKHKSIQPGRKSILGSIMDFQKALDFQL